MIDVDCRSSRILGDLRIKVKRLRTIFVTIQIQVLPRIISIKIYIKSSQFRDRSIERKNSRNIYKILTKFHDNVISWFTHKSRKI